MKQLILGIVLLAIWFSAITYCFLFIHPIPDKLLYALMMSLLLIWLPGTLLIASGLNSLEQQRRGEGQRTR